MPPLSILIKPASGSCNMRCQYCFYTDEMKNRKTAVYGKMSENVLEMLLQKAFSYGTGSITFGFQGGEPLLMGIGFYETFCRLKEKYNTKNIPRFLSTMPSS